jgi:DNA-binding MarR family transcriptional regulator
LSKCSKNRTFVVMGSYLISHLAEALQFQILRGLLTSPQPRHLRELARDYKASPAGVSDVLDRLKKAGVLVEQKRGNRRLFSLRLGDQERECLHKLFREYELQRVRHRAQRINKHPERTIARLQDMDEMYSFYRKAKRR